MIKFSRTHIVNKIYRLIFSSSETLFEIKLPSVIKSDYIIKKK